MTGISDVYVFLRPNSKNTWLQQLRRFVPDWATHTKFVVLSWQRTGSNLLCGILYNHPEIIMHNELFNNIDIYTYHPSALRYGDEDNKRWSVCERDLKPHEFLHFIWTGEYVDGTKIRKRSKAVGFKSFPEHWRDSCNEDVFTTELMENPHVKKIILYREDELEVFVSMMRAELTGFYMTHSYPENLTFHVNPAKFQAFVNRYREAFSRKYLSPTAKQDTFRITYEQLSDRNVFDKEILPALWKFLGVTVSAPAKKLPETIKQSAVDEDLSTVIENYGELEFCFRYTDVKLLFKPTNPFRTNELLDGVEKPEVDDGESLDSDAPGTWSILLPICSRKTTTVLNERKSKEPIANVNRFAELEILAQHEKGNCENPRDCWERLESFASSLSQTTTEESLSYTEVIVGIDDDDVVFGTSDAKDRIRAMLPVNVKFAQVKPVMYGKVCLIWNFLASQARNDFIVFLGDDIKLLDSDWQLAIEKRFRDIATRTGLPLGAGCVAMNDMTFQGFPTFPVMHRWHMDNFKRLLPRQFVNQDGDPYLFELYSRWNAASFVMSARLENTVGGDGIARYMKHSINWPRLILNMNLRALQGFLKDANPTGICIDVVVPSYRCNNIRILDRIVSLRGSIPLYVKFWIVVDNLDENHISEVRELAKRKSEERNDGNYYVGVLTYGANRGASFARNTGFKMSTADWILFLDDDVCPEPQLLDAYAGAIQRYPDAKVMVGQTTIPDPCNMWTEMLAASKITHFYGIARHKSHPPWGVTANILVRGSRFHQTVQFKSLYPKTGGGEDVDFVFQLKKRYPRANCVVAVPGAVAEHPWWKKGNVCYRQIVGWAWGDSQCITEWPEKTYVVFPNWAELAVMLVLFCPLAGVDMQRVVKTTLAIAIVDQVWKVAKLFKWCESKGVLRSVLVAVGASSVISSQEGARVAAMMVRLSLFSFCRRMDWFDGQAPSQVLENKLRSGILCGVYCVLIWYFVVYL